MLTESVVGAVGISQMTVRPGDTALAHGSGDMAILSASFFVTLMESACNSALADLMDNSNTTVLTDLQFEILHPVGIGMELQGAATCTAYDEGNLLFICEIHDGQRMVATGTMNRRLVDRVTFLAKSAALAMMSQQAPREN
ncbi:MAG: thioesterase family protein [Actinomycetales bacterium]|jgi:predicted thioesterase